MLVAARARRADTLEYLVGRRFLPVREAKAMHEDSTESPSNERRGYSKLDANTIRARLFLSIFIYTIGSSVVQQVSPKVRCSTTRQPGRNLGISFSAPFEGRC